MERALRRAGLTRLDFNSKRWLAFEASSTWLLQNDKERESRRMPNLMASCVSIDEVNPEGAQFAATVLRFGRARLRSLERLASVKPWALEHLDAQDEDFADTFVYALPNLETPRRIVGLLSPYKSPDSLREASRRRGYDRWRPQSKVEEARFWHGACGINCPTESILDPSHALLMASDGSRSFMPVARELLLGETVAVPTAVRLCAQSIERSLLEALCRVPWLTNVRVVDSFHATVAPTIDDRTRRQLSLFRGLVREAMGENGGDCGEHQNSEHDDVLVDKRTAKPARKTARQKERERRTQRLQFESIPGATSGDNTSMSQTQRTPDCPQGDGPRDDQAEQPSTILDPGGIQTDDSRPTCTRNDDGCGRCGKSDPPLKKGKFGRLVAQEQEHRLTRQQVQTKPADTCELSANVPASDSQSQAQPNCTGADAPRAHQAVEPCVNACHENSALRQSQQERPVTRHLPRQHVRERRKSKRATKAAIPR